MGWIICAALITENGFGLCAAWELVFRQAITADDCKTDDEDNNKKPNSIPSSPNKSWTELQMLIVTTSAQLAQNPMLVAGVSFFEKFLF